MPDLIAELSEIEAKASTIYAKYSTAAITKAIERLIETANELDSVHSGSWLGYHSCVYYSNFEEPPPGALFDRQWGLQRRYSSATVGDWVQCSYSEIFNWLKATKTKPTFEELVELAQRIATDLDDLREDLLSIVEACRVTGSDEFLDRMKEQVNKARMTSSQKFAEACIIPPPPFTNDLIAAAGGTQVPPHVAFRSMVYSARSAFDAAEELAKIAKRTRGYLSRRMAAQTMLRQSQGSRVFIGHGQSGAWLELKNYIQDRLGLQCDDFNREVTAGHSTVSRLQKMLDDACFAFLVLTAEDERKDGKTTARQNVIHEAGLFQGRLGFEKAIVMLEDGCEEFSNIHGLGQIRFDKGKIKAAFHEVADTLKREGIVSG